MNALRDLEQVARAALAPVWDRFYSFRIVPRETRAAYLVRACWLDLRGRELMHVMTLSHKLVLSGRGWAAVATFGERTVRSIRLFDAMQSLVLPWMPVEEPMPPEPGPEWCPR